MRKIIICIFIFFSLHSFAWDGQVSGKVIRIDVAGGQNYGFRVYLDGLPKLCGNNHTWAYLNDTDSNYQTYVAVLLAAKAANYNVRLYANKEGSNAYCHIGYITIN